jgi:hypothetical protein
MKAGSAYVRLFYHFTFIISITGYRFKGSVNPQIVVCFVTFCSLKVLAKADLYHFVLFRTKGSETSVSPIPEKLPVEYQISFRTFAKRDITPHITFCCFFKSFGRSVEFYGTFDSLYQAV